MRPPAEKNAIILLNLIMNFISMLELKKHFYYDVKTKY